LIGDLYLDPEEIKRREEARLKAAEKSGAGMNALILIVALIAIVYGYYKTQM
jgi:hypothetical protein